MADSIESLIELGEAKLAEICRNMEIAMSNPRTDGPHMVDEIGTPAVRRIATLPEGFTSSPVLPCGSSPLNPARPARQDIDEVEAVRAAINMHLAAGEVMGQAYQYADEDTAIEVIAALDAMRDTPREIDNV